MKNVIIVILSVLVVGMPVGYYFYRESKTKKVKSAPETMDLTVSTHQDGLKGYLLMSPSTDDEGYAVVMDMTGKVVAKKHVDGLVFDFRQWRLNGKTYYTYAKNDKAAFHGKGTFVAAGPIVMLDSALNELKQLHLLPYGDITVDRKQELDPHDLILLSENHYIALVSYEKTVTNIPESLHPYKNKKVNACMIQEVADGRVVWQWDATKFPEFYVNSVSGNTFSDSLPADYTHINTLKLDPKDGNIILSFRSLNQVIKIDRSTGNILWRLGGKNSDFPLTAEQKFLGQHAAEFINDGKTLILLDNGSPKTRPYSRVAEFELDETNKKIIAYRSYKIPHYFAQQRGNVTQVDGNYLICGGIGKYVLLVDPKTDKYLFELQSNWGTYRAYHVDSVYGLDKN